MSELENLGYEEIVDIIENKRRFGKATGNVVSAELLEKLGYPEQGMKIIHLAGTNGKGSTAAMTAYILAVAGFKVGLFTSPHLIRFNERIRIVAREQASDNKEGLEKSIDQIKINMLEISDQDVVRLGKKILEVPMVNEMTMFDACLGMCLCYYKEQKCDYVVLETGLGGTFDSTNAITEVPVVTAITNIGFDHTAILGDTLAEIAGNKAGVIKKGTRLVIAKMEEEAAQVLRDTCQWLEVDYKEIADPQMFLDRYGVEKINLLGVYQKENAANAIAIAEYVFENIDTKVASTLGLKFKNGMDNETFRDFIRCGLALAKWPGRMEQVIINGIPMIIDGAHNPQGVAALAKSLKSIYPNRKFRMIAGVLADKDYASMMEEMLPLAEKFYTVTVESSRALQGQELAKILSNKGVEAESFESIEAALERVSNEIFDENYENVSSNMSYQKYNRDMTHGELPVIAFGSLYFIGNLEEKIK